MSDFSKGVFKVLMDAANIESDERNSSSKIYRALLIMADKANDMYELWDRSSDERNSALRKVRLLEEEISKLKGAQ